MSEFIYTKENPLRVYTAFSGYDSQCMALDRIGIPYELVGWSEIDPYAIQAHNALYPEYADRNAGDISNAGLQKGLSEGSGTRSGLLWECRKAIEAKMPKYLLMENVKALLSKKFKPEFYKWRDYLTSLGYESYTKIINATECGVPQNRERAFMVSILGEHKPFHFPEPIVLEKRLKDVLEDDVDRKYFLSDKAVVGLLKHNEDHEAKGTGFI